MIGSSGWGSSSLCFGKTPPARRIPDRRGKGARSVRPEAGPLRRRSAMRQPFPGSYPLSIPSLLIPVPLPDFWLWRAGRRGQTSGAGMLPKRPQPCRHLPGSRLGSNVWKGWLAVGLLVIVRRPNRTFASRPSLDCLAVSPAIANEGRDAFPVSGQRRWQSLNEPDRHEATRPPFAYGPWNCSLRANV